MAGISSSSGGGHPTGSLDFTAGPPPAHHSPNDEEYHLATIPPSPVGRRTLTPQDQLARLLAFRAQHVTQAQAHPDVTDEEFYAMLSDRVASILQSHTPKLSPLIEVMTPQDKLAHLMAIRAQVRPVDAERDFYAVRPDRAL